MDTGLVKRPCMAAIRTSEPSACLFFAHKRDERSPPRSAEARSNIVQIALNPSVIRPDGTYSWRCPIPKLSSTGPSRPGEWLSPGAARLRREILDTGDTAWVLMSTALVMLMTPALGFFYGGLVQRKNVLSTIMHSFFILALISVQWVLWGYSLAFGPGREPHRRARLARPARESGRSRTPTTRRRSRHSAFMAFQMMFAVITPALISGAFAERKRFKALVIFSLLWATLVYAPVAHWVWGVGGWLRTYGRARLRRRHRRPHHRGRVGAGRREHARQAHRLRQRAAGAAQPDLHGARRRSPLVRLVRLQRAAARSARTGWR